MKAILFSALMLFSSKCLLAQIQHTASKDFKYISLGVERLQDGGAFHLSYNRIRANNKFISVGLVVQKQIAANLPADYYGGADFSGNRENYPFNSATFFSLGYGKVMPTKTRLCRFILSGKALLGWSSKPVNFERVHKNYAPGLEGVFEALFDREPNYTFQKKKQIAVGVMLNPKVDFPLLRKVGISVGPTLSLSTSGPTYGFETTMNFGRLRNRLKKQ